MYDIVIIIIIMYYYNYYKCSYFMSICHLFISSFYIHIKYKLQYF